MVATSAFPLSFALRSTNASDLSKLYAAQEPRQSTGRSNQSALCHPPRDNPVAIWSADPRALPGNFARARNLFAATLSTRDANRPNPSRPGRLSSLLRAAGHRRTRDVLVGPPGAAGPGG